MSNEIVCGVQISHISFKQPQDIDIIYYTGDFADHFGWLSTMDTVKYTIEFITSQFKLKFPNKPVAMVIGNHDIHPSDA